MSKEIVVEADSGYGSDHIQSLLYRPSTVILGLCKNIFQTLQSHRRHLGGYMVTPVVVEEDNLMSLYDGFCIGLPTP
jgi:hypothetical protein